MYDDAELHHRHVQTGDFCDRNFALYLSTPATPHNSAESESFRAILVP